MSNAGHSKILLVQLFSNGDCLYATTVAMQIKEDYPNCKLTWAIADFCKSIIANNPYVDEILAIEGVEKNKAALVHKKVNELISLKGDVYDHIFVTQDTFGRTHANFDGYIRSRILISYPNKIMVPLQPTLVLLEEEKLKVKDFVHRNLLSSFKKVILFEFAPLSGQINLTRDDAIKLATSITNEFSDVAVILSSANKVQSLNSQIIDGSELTLRATAFLTHYCHYLLGCSSGITWVTTSTAAKMLPMVQLIDPAAVYLNSPKNDFEKFGIKNEGIIEVHNFDVENIQACFRKIIHEGFDNAVKDFDCKTSLNFKTTPLIVYNLITSFKWQYLVRHWQVNVKQNGLKFYFIVAFLKGILFTPFYFIRNKIKKAGIYKP